MEIPVKIALAAQGRLLTLDVLDENKIRKFINDNSKVTNEESMNLDVIPNR